MIYVVTMYRWGDREKHSYVHGVFSTEEIALAQAETEQMWRGGFKYVPEIVEFKLDDAEYFRVVLELKSVY